jgi:Protein of unknown function (DUF2384)
MTWRCGIDGCNAIRPGLTERIVSDEELSVIKIEFLQKWMRTANPQLGGAVPLDLMYQGMGRRVAQFIDSAWEASGGPVETEVKP